MSCGLIFILSDDPISRIVTSITKQEFSSLGYYYTFNGNVYVNIPDPFGVPLFKEENLNNLLRCPFVKRVSLRPIIPEKEKIFRLALTKTTNKPPLSYKEGIYWLFGFPSLSSGYSSLSRIEEALKRLDIHLVQNSINTLYGSGYENCINPPSKEKGYESRVQFIAYLASFLNQQTCPENTLNGHKLPVQIQSYILENKYFLPHQKLQVVPNENKDLFKEIYRKQLPRIQKGFSVFLSLLSEQSFLYLLSKSSRNSKINLLEESLDSLTTAQDSFLLSLQGLIPNNKLKILANDLNLEREKSFCLLGKKLNPLSEGKENTDSLEKFRQILYKTSKGKKIDLKELADIYHNLSGEKINIPPETKGKYYYGKIEEVRIPLKSGETIYLTENVNFSSLDYETLVESLDFLSVKKEHENIRILLAEEIASYSSSHIA